VSNPSLFTPDGILARDRMEFGRGTGWNLGEGQHLLIPLIVSRIGIAIKPWHRAVVVDAE
jgi:hypothetical protein